MFRRNSSKNQCEATSLLNKFFAWFHLRKRLCWFLIKSRTRLTPPKGVFYWKIILILFLTYKIICWMIKTIADIFCRQVVQQNSYGTSGNGKWFPLWLVLVLHRFWLLNRYKQKEIFLLNRPFFNSETFQVWKN